MSSDEHQDRICSERDERHRIVTSARVSVSVRLRWFQKTPLDGISEERMNKDTEIDRLEARRRFLAKCGKFAVITPPAMTVLLSSTAQNYAVAASGGGGRSFQGNNGFGNGGGDGVPGNSANNPSPQAGSKAADQNR
jgi:hypothetical protein